MTPTESTVPTADLPMPLGTTTDLLAEPTIEECHAEWIRYHEDLKAGRLGLQDIHADHHLAYYGGRLVDHDADLTLLCARAAATLGVHPARIVIAYPWMW